MKESVEPATGVSRGPSPGRDGNRTVVRVLAAEGDRVTAGQPLVVLEAMKMEHTVAAPPGGTVTGLPAAAGEQVTTGQVIATIEAGPPRAPHEAGLPRAPHEDGEVTGRAR